LPGVSPLAAEICAVPVVPEIAIGMVEASPEPETVAAIYRVPVYWPVAVIVTVCDGGTWF
jgi:hypothetical protein